MSPHHGPQSGHHVVNQAPVLVQDAVKVMAKSLVRNRHAVTKMYGLKSQLQAVSLRMATLKSTQAMADAMRGATKVSYMAQQPCLPDSGGPGSRY